jgi:hypothetical protein
MSDEHTPTLQEMAADRDWWRGDAGEHHRESAHWLRGVAAKCRLPYTQRELLDFARRYDARANRCDSGCVNRPMIGETPDWASWAIAGLLALMMLLPLLKC